MEPFTSQEELHARVGEHLLKRFSRLMERHASRLESVCDTPESADTDRVKSGPVHILAEPRERSVLPLLAAGENRVLSKVLLALSALCAETRLLCDEARNELAPALLLYGEGDDEVGEDVTAGGQAQLQLAQILPTLQRVLCLSDRARQVSSNVLQQLAALHDPARRPLTTSGYHLQVVFEHLGELLASLALLDEVIARQAGLHEHYTLYKVLVRRARLQPGAFNMDASQVALMERLLSDLDGRVMNAGLLHSTLRQPFQGVAQSVVTCREFHAEFLLTINNMILQLESEAQEPDLEDGLVVVAALLVLHARLAKHSDAKTVRQLWAVHRRRPAVLLGGGQVWSLDGFLSTHLADFDQLVDRKSRDSASAASATSLTSSVQSLPRTLKDQTLQVMAWTVAVSSTCRDDPTRVTVAVISEAMSLLRRGLSLMEQISDGARQLLDMHAHTAKPLAAATAVLVCRQIELLKAMEATLNDDAASWTRQVSRCAAQHAQYRLVKLISVVRERVTSDKKLLDERLDLVSGLETSERAVAGAATRQRLLLARLALSLCTQPAVFRDGELVELVDQLRRLQLATRLPEQLRQATDCTFLYWSRSLLPAYLRDVASRPDDPRRLQLMCAALRDPVSLLKRARHMPSPQLIHLYETELIDAIQESLVKPLCADVETELRLDVHAHLQLDDRNPFKVGLKDRRALLAAPPLRLVTGTLNIRRHVEKYLERTFYNLTAVAQHDWRTYAQMRHLAREKYGLETCEPHLPGQTLEQGLDVLEVMRNIHVFVVHYAYNLTNQFFVERQSNNKHLNTIGIQHVANSMRTHGTGIIATTINFAYQFLRRKLGVLSQFLFDEQISSRLTADGRRDQLDGGDGGASNGQYQYQRAARFERAIRALGLSSDGLSYLDRCRQLVTQLGGALAFVRLVRSGNLHCTSAALQFVPDLAQQGGVFAAAAEAAQLDEVTRLAAETLDACLADLIGSGDQNTAYFRLLEHALSPSMRDEKNRHLRAFHLLVPPLCLAHVQHMLAGKERLAKNARSGALFTDDGFAMGIAFLLKLLDLNQAFDALYFMEAVSEHHATEIAAAEGQGSEPGSDDTLQQAIGLTKKRLERSQREFQLLFYNLSAARVFFRSAPAPVLDVGQD